MPNGRCRMHGGKLRGPVSVFSWPQTLPLAWAARAKRQAERKALGLPWYGGRPRKWRLKLASREVVAELMSSEIKKIPDAPAGPIEEWSPSELLQQAGKEGLIRLYRCITEPREGLPDKLVIHGDNMALGAVKIFQAVWEAQLRDRQSNGLDELMARIAQEEAKGQKS